VGTRQDIRLKAVVYHGPRDVEVEAWPDPPDPGPGEVRLRVLRASICGTDVEEYVNGPRLIPMGEPHPASGKTAPLVLGHEILGSVEALGADVSEFQPGDRVAPGSGIWCRRCVWCRSGRPNLCASYHTVGLHLDGGLAEAVNVPAWICRSVGSDCPDDNAVLAQPLAVALHTVRRANPVPNESVAVVGIGGVGSFVVVGCIARGNRVIAVDVGPSQLKVALELGAAVAVNASRESPERAIRSHTAGEGCDVVVEASGTAAGLRTAIGSVRRGGRVILVGLQNPPSSIDLHDLVLKEVDIVTSKVHICDVDLPDALGLLEKTNLAATIDSVIALDDAVSLGLERLAAGECAGKVIIKP
jgi:(R,R)-butanediol dehydrogenase / meso-butanediol dehydrogenase / diacetyl reductase